MFIFLRLILAHLIADCIFQPDELYRIKKRGFYGVVIHSFIIFLILSLFSLPYFKYSSLWLFLIFTFATHIIQDEIKIRYITSKKWNFIAFIGDQIIHIIFISPIIFLSKLYEPNIAKNIIVQIYNNDSLVIFCIGYIVSVFLGAYTWEAFKISYFKNPSLFNPSAIKYGMFERFIITTSLLNNYYIIFLLIPLLFRMPLRKLFSSELIFNLVFSSLIGLFLRQYLPIF